jgi:hypothetical protein
MKLRQLAMDIVEGRVFGTWNLTNPDDVGLVFAGTMFMSAEQAKELQQQKVAHFYEYLDKAGPRSFNGMPMFFSMHYLTEEDVESLKPMIEELKAQKQAFLANEV